MLLRPQVSPAIRGIKRFEIDGAREYAKNGKRVCILNFASSVSPGGGVVTGAQAQEESICRVSTLYFALSDKESAGRFYDYHWELIDKGEMNRKNRDDIIYTPGVCGSEFALSRSLKSLVTSHPLS